MKYAPVSCHVLQKLFSLQKLYYFPLYPIKIFDEIIIRYNTTTIAYYYKLETSYF